MRGGFTIGNKNDGNWLAVQQWARENTPKDAVFIVPPKEVGFRVDGERTIYGDWKDGTQMFFNPSFGQEWMRRMKMLGYVDDSRLGESYAELTAADFEKIKSELESKHSDVYIIQALRTELPFPVVFPAAGTSNSFTVYRMK
jgi:hypothetical protein